MKGLVMGRGSAARLALVVVLSACSAPGPMGVGERGVSQEQRTEPKRVTAAILFDLKGLGLAINNQTPPGGPEVQHLVNSGLTMVDNLGVRQPQLGESVPTIGNRLKNVTGRNPGATESWNSWEWDVVS